MVNPGFEFKVTQPDGTETSVKVPNVDLSLPDLMEHIDDFLVAAGYHRDTIAAYYDNESNDESGS